MTQFYGMMLQSTAGLEGARLEGARQGMLLGTIMGEGTIQLIVGLIGVWFWTFVFSLFLATKAPPDERAFKTVFAATLLCVIWGFSANGFWALIYILPAIGIYYYERRRYRKGWIDDDPRDTFQ